MSKKMVPAVVMSFDFKYRFKDSKESRSWDYSGIVEKAVTIEEALKLFYEEVAKENHEIVEIENIEADPTHTEKNFFN